MTCQHCCDAEQIFNEKEARKSLKAFKKSGAKGSTKELLSLLNLENASGISLLDIGGGIGAIQWYFLAKGAAKTTDVDASSAYIKVAKSYSIENNLLDRTYFIQGDFVDLSGEMERHDYVTMDKVLCCYPDFRKLLRAATSKCDYRLAITFPLGGFIPRIISKLGAIYFKLKGSAFRAYIHSPKSMTAFIEEQGFKLKEKTVKFPWHVRVYERI